MDIPLPPEITDKDIQRCREKSDFSPIFFEWYKYVGLLANFYASIQLDSPAIRDIPENQYAVIIGLLNRCSRLMLSNTALSHEGLFGETTLIIDRCIFESSTKLSWLCFKADQESFGRFIADGLKTELELKKEIESNIKARGGKIQKIEERMLQSIEKYLSKSGMTEEQIKAAKKLPDLAAMLKKIGHERFKNERLIYVASQKMGSHHVHGTWVGLRFHYLDEINGVIAPRDHNCSTTIDQYVYISRMVLEAIVAFIRFVCSEKEDIKDMSTLPVSVSNEIYRIYLEAVGNDFETI